MPRRVRGWQGLDAGLSVLDFCTRFEEAAELGTHVESLGYRRYWFAEHPPQPNAELFVALLSAMTSKLRVGTGGIVLRLRNALQTACNLQFLHWAFAGRIDMGFCMGGAAPEVEVALSAPHAVLRTPQEYDERVGEVLSLLRGPSSATEPEIWLLGTGLHSARQAATLGACYAYSLFHSRSNDDVAALDLYRTQFRPTSAHATARTMLAFSGLCAASDAEAARQLRGFTSAEIRPVIWGGMETCADRLADLLARYRPDELMLYDLSPSIEDKKDSYQRWAEVVDGLVARR
jgi:alkanesulfonate monooxygenase SsuD/methylene tetrahydromethanopterin reductase-like flavin-dependent oxidoreductase (luciferase family)